MNVPRQPTKVIDEAVRKKAVEDFSTSFSVEASAGTGKTTLLANRYVNLLQFKAGTVSSVVAITFTEKAANELKRRIETLLVEKGLTEPLAELKSAYVSTIHAFCARILRERALEIGLNPEFEVMDPMTTSLALKKYFYRWLSQLQPQATKVVQRSMASGITLDQIFDVSGEMYKYRDLIDSLPEATKVEPVSTWLRATSFQVEALWKRAQECCINPHDQGFEQIESLEKLLRNAAKLSQGESERILLHRFYVKAPKGAQKNWNPPQALKDQKEILERIAEEAREKIRDLRSSVFCELLHVLKGYVGFVQAEKEKASRLDFDDLLFRVRDLLRSDEQALSQVQGQFTHLLVDEYQDTDPIQAEIVWRLASKGHRKEWMQAELTPGKIFSVGDPKQSIYRFRRASIEIYKDTSDALVASGERLVITQNFRSTTAVVEAINAIFQTIFSENYSLLVAREADHVSTKDEPGVVVLDPPIEFSKARAQEWRKMESHMIARYLRKLLDDPNEKISPGDIAILFPTSTGMDYYEEALREASVPFSVEGGSAFFHRLEIHGILAVLKAIVAPYDPVAVVAALRSVVLGLSDEDLFTAAGRRKTFDYRVESQKDLPEKIEQAFDLLKTLHACVHESASVVLDKIIDATWAIPISLFRFHGEQAAANIQKLHMLAMHLESSGIDTCERFLSWVEDTLKEKSQTTEALLSENDDQHVRLLTIHRSKGLEFPVVVLANLSGTSHQGESVLANRQENWLEMGIGPQEKRFSTPNYEIKWEEEKKSKELEKQRLLYVAVTRAKRKLVLVSQDAQNSSYWNWMQGVLQQNQPWLRRIPYESLPDHETSILGKEMAADEGVWLQRLKEQHRQLQIEKRMDAKPLLDKSPEQTTEAFSYAFQLGTAFHRVMEQIDISSPDTKSIIPVVCAELGIPFLRPEVEALVDKFFAMEIWKRIKSAKMVHREIPFAMEYNGQTFEGSMDLLFQDDSGWTIVDYKTDKTIGAWGMESYEKQIILYALAAEKKLHIQVHQAALVFVYLQEVKIVELNEKMNLLSVFESVS